MAPRLIGIARAPVKRGPLEELAAADVSVDSGIAGDSRGVKQGRQITVLFREGWDDACRELGVTLPWIARRANLYVEGLERPRRTGDTLRIGEIVLAVTEETDPCNVMELAHRGLKNALAPDWRGGVCCNVLAGGAIRIGDPVELTQN
jgi:MOSC domain-containing protein YiiM